MYSKFLSQFWKKYQFWKISIFMLSWERKITTTIIFYLFSMEYISLYSIIILLTVLKNNFNDICKGILLAVDIYKFHLYFSYFHSTRKTNEKTFPCIDYSYVTIIIIILMLYILHTANIRSDDHMKYS